MTISDNITTAQSVQDAAEHCAVDKTGPPPKHDPTPNVERAKTEKSSPTTAKSRSLGEES